MGISIRKGVNQYKDPWSGGEIELLKKTYPITPTKELPKRLNRTLRSIRSHAHSLNLRKDYFGLVPKLSLSDRDIGYLAGAVDGEGSVSLHRVKYKVARNNTLRTVVDITNTNKDFIEKIRSLIPGSVGTWCDRAIGQKPRYRFIVQGHLRCYAILNAIKSELVIKKRQTELLLEFCERRMRKKEGGRNIPYDEREWEIYHEMRKLNKRGVRI